MEPEAGMDGLIKGKKRVLSPKTYTKEVIGDSIGSYMRTQFKEPTVLEMNGWGFLM